MRGHVDVKYSLLMFAIVGAIGAEMLYRQRTGESFLSLVPLWVWLALAVAAALAAGSPPLVGRRRVRPAASALHVAFARRLLAAFEALQRTQQ
jgi:hypothetical protein